MRPKVYSANSLQESGAALAQKDWSTESGYRINAISTVAEHRGSETPTLRPSRRHSTGLTQGEDFERLRLCGPILRSVNSAVANPGERNRFFLK